MEQKNNHERQHPGFYIRKNIIPSGMNVTEAAKLLGVGRPALSNLLNGKAGLSPDMAARIERAFCVTGHSLMELQAAYDAYVAKGKGAANNAKPYVPPYLQLKANDIENWAKEIRSRSRFAVFLRTLLYSTGTKLTRVEFPGNDDAERSGWDGSVTAEEGTPWIPQGKSGWEFGVNQNPKEKADKDYLKRTDQTSSAERLETTFVFVTPMRWPGKETWEKKHKAEGSWKDIRVFDSSNLEEWLDQSIPAQVWLGNELKIDLKGIFSLDACWQKWVADCDPIPHKSLFNPAIEHARTIVKTKFLKNPIEPITITTDSTLEALAFLNCLFSTDDRDFFLFRDRVIVFDNHETLSKLVSKSSYFIAVSTNNEVERELAPYIQNLRSILIYPRNATNVSPDIILEPLSYREFDNALSEMGCSRDEINAFALESGRSLTILRRRLSKLEAIRTPTWSTNQRITKTLIPLLFAGVWNSENETDRNVIQLLTNNTAYSEIDKSIASLLCQEDSPLWAIGGYIGVTSKIDALFAINKCIVKDDLEQFLTIAHIVLEEDDPSLDLPEDQQFMAGIIGKVRNISKPLRESICETVVLLAIHGNYLFRDRINIDIEVRIGQLIEALLNPLTVRVLEAHSYDLPMYAEAAPKKFLELIEQDLESADSQSLQLMRPVSSTIFGRCNRTGLIWALENLAWSPEYLTRTVLILGKLSQKIIGDNWSNTPRKSLSLIFCSWMPQTSANVEQRIEVLNLLEEKFPDTAWEIYIEQFDNTRRAGFYSHKPRWRKYGHGYGEPIRDIAAIKFEQYAFQKALNWKDHTQKTIGDLISNVNELGNDYQILIWNLVENWVKTASEFDKSWLREKIRVSVLTRRAQIRRERLNIGNGNLEQIRSIYNSLQPRDVILKHEWLFRKAWIEDSIDGIEDEDVDFRKRDEKIIAKRMEALKEVFAEKGTAGILALAEMGEASQTIGWFIPKIFDTTDQLINVIRYILDCGPLIESKSRNEILLGALSSLPKERTEDVLHKLLDELTPSEVVPVLTLCPFNNSTWKLLKLQNKNEQDCYWKLVKPFWPPDSNMELQFAVEKLLEVDRPRVAFQVVEYNFEKILPKQLFRILKSISESNNEDSSPQRIDSYSVCRIFNWLNDSREISIDEMAGLEFRYIDLLDQEEYRIINLEKHLEKHPELFVQVIVFAFKRDDEKEDPVEYQASNLQHRHTRALFSLKLLDKLTSIAEKNQFDEPDPSKISLWVDQVRSECTILARGVVCDIVLGNIFARSPVGKDGVWPIQPIREVLEKVITKNMADGITTELYNSRGAHWRGNGGEQERELAEKYRNWAQMHQFAYPRVSEVLFKLADTYEREANWQDTTAKVRKRLGD